eukprot:gene23165-biopygen19315
MTGAVPVIFCLLCLPREETLWPVLGAVGGRGLDACRFSLPMMGRSSPTASWTPPPAQGEREKFRRWRGEGQYQAGILFFKNPWDEKPVTQSIKTLWHGAAGPQSGIFFGRQSRPAWGEMLWKIGELRRCRRRPGDATAHVRAGLRLLWGGVPVGERCAGWSAAEAAAAHSPSAMLRTPP